MGSVHPQDSQASVPAGGSGRRYSPLYKAGAAAGILTVLFGGGWASLASTRAAIAIPGASEMDLSDLSRRLAPEAVASETPQDCADAAEGLVRAARLAGIDPREILQAALPEPSRILGMLALDRDVDDFLEYAGRTDAAGAYYREEARLSLEMRPLRGRYEAAFAAAHAALSGVTAAASPGLGALKRKRPYIASPEEAWLPARSELHLSHPYALDVFFFRVDRRGEAERGPVIRALYPGLVVASSADWSGGQGVSRYRSGGLSPAAGNGLVIYDPAARVYCSYFHLSSVALRTGAVVDAGASLGRGGNTGMNARTASHGGHVHIEIFDAASDLSLSAYEILELLKK
jgi:murein DD-endopeptidase MepM/ murein hydrolase activator NlpD